MIPSTTTAYIALSRVKFALRVYTFARTDRRESRFALTHDDELDPGLLGAEAVDALALVDAGVVAVGVAHAQEALALAVARPRDVVDRLAVLKTIETTL